MRTFVKPLALLFLISFFLPAKSIHAQSVGINFNAAAPNSSAALDIDVTGLVGSKKGLLIPRVTLSQRTAMNPLPVAAQGLIVYQTDGVEGIYYNTSLTTTPNWIYNTPTPTSAGWALTGNALTGASSSTPNEWLGSSNAYDWILKTNGVERMRILSTGNIGIGTTTPGYMLHANGNIGAANAIGVINNTNGGGIGLAGQNSGTVGAGVGIGVYAGTQQSGGYGLYSVNFNPNGTGLIAFGNNFGSYSLPFSAGGAFFANLTGVYGFALNQTGYGVYGKATNATNSYGVVGMSNNVTGPAPSTGSGGAFIGNSYGLSAYQYTTSGQTAAGYFISGDGAGGAASTTLVEAFSNVGTHYKIWENVVGTVSTSVPDLNGKPATLHAIETPEFYFQDFGQGKLVNGKTHIDIDPILAKNITINDKHPLRVFIQLEGDCKGVYVTNKTATGFDVVELNGGTSNVDFQWSITCNVADAKIGNRISKFSDLRFEPGPLNETKALREENTQTIGVLPVQNK